jgi:hypothetical protein
LESERDVETDARFKICMREGEERMRKKRKKKEILREPRGCSGGTARCHARSSRPDRVRISPRVGGGARGGQCQGDGLDRDVNGG